MGNKNSSSSSEAISYCPQLIWGKNLEPFREEYGCSQVILGTDLFYMTKSVAPLFQTVHELMTPDVDDDDDDGDNIQGGCFVAVMTCSAQSPKSTVVDVATKYGFQWTTLTFSSSCGPSDRADSFERPEDNDMDDVDRIYIFRRRRRRGCRRND